MLSSILPDTLGAVHLHGQLERQELGASGAEVCECEQNGVRNCVRVSVTRVL
jgi:hypothetical protein